jgi:hypothetical protein
MTTSNRIEDKDQAHQAAIWEEWARRLESGDYPQTRGTLHRLVNETFADGEKRVAGFCCLGVAAEIACDLGVGVRQLSEDGKNHQYRHVKEPIGTRDSGTLTLGLATWLGLNRLHSRYNEGDFISANDAEHQTFPEIAGMVRRLNPEY